MTTALAQMWTPSPVIQQPFQQLEQLHAMIAQLTSSALLPLKVLSLNALLDNILLVEMIRALTAQKAMNVNQP